MKVSRRSQVPPFAVMEVLAAANARRDAGESIINLCAGQPSSGASEVVRDRATALLASGDLGYTEAVGAPALRRAIAGHYAHWYGVDVDPAQVAVATGSSGAFLLAFLAAFDPGDRVALARPGYPAYKNILTSLGCEVVELACGPQTRYQPTVQQLTQAYYEGGLDGVILASPANPTGTMVEPTELEALAAWCAQYEVRLISDEIYHGITYDGEVQQATAAGHVGQGAVVVSSFSKYWAMTGWRLGWLVLPPDLVAPVDALAGNVALCPPALAQHAAVVAFSPQGYAAAEADVAQYEASRALLLRRLPELGWGQVAPPDGAFYLYADISASGLDSVTWCARLLDEAGVALTPGTDFDSVDGREWVRLSFASAPDLIDQAVDRIVAWQATITHHDLGASP
ncbi:pyridoxal phosphate-dependent aminotransferase [Actinotalea sp. K2]|uniref:pyridoxal phosphate-dependent aminotransferase n=1 Tax=Actinotalea sp. K2 TaxID=2939438 RepID=UPI0020176A77|nr:aminotransferase class I/II-fold pyridoxal phosphate-dependent enzyme [Actinotalea sp. K2]MCL3860908.1 aminotransferase class I/II-fold pyridoxal phosphate-dependent enzyme [Actinotalea sp. K2]